MSYYCYRIRVTVAQPLRRFLLETSGFPPSTAASGLAGPRKETLMRNSNTARRLIGAVAAGAVSLTACAVVMLAPTSADAVNSLRINSLVHSLKVHSLNVNSL